MYIDELWYLSVIIKALFEFFIVYLIHLFSFISHLMGLLTSSSRSLTSRRCQLLFACLLLSLKFCLLLLAVLFALRFVRCLLHILVFIELELLKLNL